MSDAPPIRYCRTEDGVNIAYWTLGEGPPVLVVHSPPMSHVSLEWDVPRFRQFYEALAKDFRVLRYNPRGTGLSGSADTVHWTFALDVSALLRAAQADTVSVLSCGNGVNTAGPIVAHLGDSVRAFVALGPGLDLAAPMMGVQKALHAAAPEIEGLLLARTMDPEGIDPSRSLAAVFDNAMTGEAHERMREEAPDMDTLRALRDIRAPVLVAHYPDEGMYEGGPEMAATVTDSRLVVRPGRGYPLYDPDPESLYRLVRDFLLEHAGQPPATTAQTQSPPDDTIPLSLREREVIALIAEGSTNAQIAEALVISPGTVARHVSNMLAKTACKNRAELTRYAIEHGLAGPHA